MESVIMLRFCALTTLIVIAAASRIVPHPPNFTPIAAMALFGGATFSDKRVAFLIPLSAMILSDAAVGGFSLVTPWIYGSFGAIVCIGFLLRGTNNAIKIALGALAGAILFFVVTNFAVWLAGDYYPKTAAGVEACFIAAIPFFRNTLSSDALYTALLFGSWHLLERRWPSLRAGAATLQA
jgi:hypothetical protein